MENYFIIHGSFGHSKENWFPWLENELKNRKKEVFNMDFPVGIGIQNYNNWEKVLSRFKEHINKETIFICHSIGCVFLVKYCIENNIQIKKAIFVAGVNNQLGQHEEFDSVNKTMFTSKTEKFKSLCSKRICFYSNNDPYIKIEKLKEFAKEVNAQEVLIENAGHFNEGAGYITFEEILNYI